MPKRIRETPQSAALREAYRKSLIDLGKSPDCHVYDLGEGFYSNYASPKSLSFIQRIVDFYAKLDGIEKLLFVKEVLEKGRHYPFWYINHFEDGEFVPAYERLQKRIGGIAL